MRGDTLSLLHWNHIWPMMIITPHLSSGGNARTRATVPTHKKSHNPHPQGGGWIHPKYPNHKKTKPPIHHWLIWYLWLGFFLLPTESVMTTYAPHTLGVSQPQPYWTSQWVAIIFFPENEHNVPWKSMVGSDVFPYENSPFFKGLICSFSGGGPSDFYVFANLF